MDGLNRWIASNCKWLIGLLLSGLVAAGSYINDLENRIIVLEAYTKGIAGTLVRSDGPY